MIKFATFKTPARLESELRPFRPLYDLKVLKGIVMNQFL